MANTITSPSGLRPDDEIQSTNGYHRCHYQTDGNLVLYSLGKAVWDSGTAGKHVDHVSMQNDGNLVIYAPEGWVWQSHTAGVGVGPFRLGLQNDRNLVIYDSNDHPTWSTATSTDPALWDTMRFERTAELDQVLSNAQNDPHVGAMFQVGVVCDVPGPHVIYCVAALIVIAIALECNKDDAWGPNNDLRRIGGDLSQGVKDAGKSISDWWRDKTAGFPRIPKPHWWPLLE